MESGMTVISLGCEYDATRAAALEAAVARVDGVGHVELNYTNNKVTVRFDPERTDLNELADLVAREKKRHTRSIVERNVGEVD